jgi:hypothetical protein
MTEHAPTHDDVTLVLRLYELRRDDKLRAARDWFSFKFFPRSLDDVTAVIHPSNPDNAHFRMITSYWDMAASFVVTGPLNAELFMQSAGEMMGLWAKLGPFVPGLRAMFGDPRYLSNIEQAVDSVPWVRERVELIRQWLPKWEELLAQPASTIS